MLGVPDLVPASLLPINFNLLGGKQLVVKYMCLRSIFDAESNFEVKNDF